MPIDFSKKNTKPGGQKFHDKDFTTSNSRWIDEASKRTGEAYIYFNTTLVGKDGAPNPRNFLLGSSEEFRNLYGIVVNDGVLEKIDEDKPDYEPKETDETSKLFNSMEVAGVSSRIVQNIDTNPSAIDGYTFHFVEDSKGYKRKDKNGQETKFDATWLVVEKGGLKSAPGGNRKASTASAASKPKSKVVEPEPDEEETDAEDQEQEEVDPLEQAASDTIQAILANPKKLVPNWNAKANGGGVTGKQMYNAALGNAMSKEHKELGKVNVAKKIKSGEVGEKFNGELWAYDSDHADNGLYTTL